MTWRLLVGIGVLLAGNVGARAAQVSWSGRADRTTKVGSKCEVEMLVPGVGVAVGAAIVRSGRTVGTCARVYEKSPPWYSNGDRRNVCVGTVKDACTRLRWTNFTVKGESCFPVVKAYVPVDGGAKCRAHLKVGKDKATATARCQASDVLHFMGATVKGSDFAFDESGGATIADSRTCKALKAAHGVEQETVCAAEAEWRKREGKVVLNKNEQAPAGTCPKGVEELRIVSWGSSHFCRSVRVCVE